MKEIDEIKKTSGLMIRGGEKKNGFGGTYNIVEYKNGKPKIKQQLNFMISWACGFEHLSVSTPVRCPTWNEMQMMKEIFFKDDEVCMQLHPAKENYINNMEYCLHIWRPINKEIPCPPNIMVGLRPTHIKEDVAQLIKFSQDEGIEFDDETLKELKTLGVEI